MKKISFIAILALLITGFVSCSKDGTDYNSPSGNNTSTSSIITQGSWRITYFTDGGIDATSNFSGYAFVFDTSHAVAAINGSAVTNGTWSTGDSQNKFMVSFGVVAPPLDALKEEWTITTKLNNMLQMQKLSVSRTEYLTIERIP